ncbi:MAG: nicotinate-nucleotide adenylyltransferase [Nitrospira sp.]|nr:nicotinate-nucleotide adenylyltransferase [Nitrospira sp.]
MNASPPVSHPSPFKLGLLGGSFNPIHNGHLAVAREVRDRLGLDRVLFIPAGDPPHKRNGSLASATDRYEMVRLAVAGTPSFDLSDIEIKRTGKSYSIDTVRALERQFGLSTDLYFLIGLDAFLDVHNWKAPLELLQACRFVVVPRPGQLYRHLASVPLLPNLDHDMLAKLDAGILPRLDISSASCRGVICLPIPLCPISASDIRRRVRNGDTLANLLPPPVESYILRHRLYQEDHDRTNI